MNQQDTPAPSTPAQPKKPRGVWGSEGKVFGGLKVAGRTVFLGQFASIEEAAARVQAAEALRDQRKAIGMPLYKSELLGQLVGEEPDLLAGRTDEERQAQRANSRQRRLLRLWRSMPAAEKASTLQKLNVDLRKEPAPKRIAA